ncbi:MAG: transcriptional repressor [Bacteroidetes bacterium]|nr:MAG: transcriptional repressor [Bacteroidota bacterium]PTM13261.1 MAG: transcriptional repressor [Bacteroidota bacterium]
MEHRISDLLKKHGLRSTTMREEVLRTFFAANKRALDHPELERRLPHADRITLYRTLKTFAEKGLIHEVVDGGLATKYALCPDSCTEHQHHDEHAHFHCQDCGKTICLEATATATVQVPTGFRVKQTHLVVEGSCDECF